MNAIEILILILLIAGWGVAACYMREYHRYRSAWKNIAAEREKESEGRRKATDMYYAAEAKRIQMREGWQSCMETKGLLDAENARQAVEIDELKARLIGTKA